MKTVDMTIRLPAAFHRLLEAAAAASRQTIERYVKEALAADLTGFFEAYTREHDLRELAGLEAEAKEECA